jgi:hypothetical protein
MINDNWEWKIPNIIGLKNFKYNIYISISLKASEKSADSIFLSDKLLIQCIIWDVNNSEIYNAKFNISDSDKSNDIGIQLKQVPNKISFSVKNTRKVKSR